MTDVEDVRQVKGFCPMDCPDTCAWVVDVKDSEAVQLAGNREHPITRGALCVKVSKYLEYARSPDRILYPLRRIGPKGAGLFKRISWADALQEIGDRWGALIRRHGAQAIWPYCGDGAFGMLLGTHGGGRRLWNVLGTSQHLNTICTIAGGVGTGYTVGDNRMGMDPETMTESRLIILWGANTLSTNQHLRPRIDEARRRGAHVVVVDPIRSRTAEYADEHVALLPGTDAAFALGLLHVVVKLGAEDRDFLANHTLGWDAFRDRIMQFPPERVAQIAGVPRAQIEALGERLAATRPTAIRMSMGLQRHAGGGMAVRTISCIPGVTGDWKHAGGGAVYDIRGFFKGDWNALWRDDLRPAGTRALRMTRLGDHLLDLKDPPVQSIFVYGANPVASNPQQGRVRQGLAREDLFTVVVEHFRTDTVNYADIVLPSTMQVEHQELQHSYGHLYLAWNEPAVSPPGECLSHSEIFRRLARQLGLQHPCLYESEEEMARQVLSSGDPSLSGITLERLKREGFVRLNYPSPLVPFQSGFPTPSGKLEFYSERMLEAGLDPVAGYTPPAEALDDKSAFPLALLTPASHNFLNSVFANWPAATRREGNSAVLWMHPEDACARNLSSGDMLRIFNDRGEFTAQAVVTEHVRRGVVASFKGHWPIRNSGSNANATVAERDSDMGGGAVFHDNRVQVERASELQPN